MLKSMRVHGLPRTRLRSSNDGICRFGELIRGFAAAAVASRELPADEDPGRLAFELNGIMLAADTNFVLHDDPGVLDLARQIVHQRLDPS